MPPSVGMRFGRYELLSRIGAGGMGEVWRARDHDLHRDVAVKFLPERFAADPTRFGRFTQEALAASKLNHPNIVTIHDASQTSGLHYIVMELVEGDTLRAILLAHGERPLSARRLLEIGGQIADGLAKAHGAGIVHRDLKPENVMVTSDGFVKILDFGLVKLLSEASGGSEWFDSAAPTVPESASPQTAVGAVLGTAGYMSPEQARGRPVDYRSDQFALGSILYEMATGREAFRRETPAQTIAAIIEDSPPPLATVNPALPPPARWIVERCLAKEPVERYASTLDLARELRNVRERLPEVSSSGSSPYAAVSAGLRRGWKRTAATGIVALAVLALAWGAWEAWKRVGPSGPGRVPVVAVLPLTNLTGQQEYDATAVGIAEVLVSSLAEVQGIQVLSRPSTAAYRDRKGDLPAIARQLDATYLVDGVLQRSEQRLRVSFSLVRSSSNVVEWSGTFDGAFPQLFDLQSRVADGVASALRLSVSPAERARIEARPTASPSAWQEYTAALDLLDRVDRPGNAARAIEHLEAALRADPRFARAHAALGHTFWTRYQETGDAAWAEKARDAVQEALRLAPEDADTRLSLAIVYEGRGRAAEALEEVRKALAIRPNSDAGLRQLAYLLADMGQTADARDAARRAMALRPAFAENYNALGWVEYVAGQLGEAATAYRRQTELQPDNAWAFQMLGTCLMLQGDVEGAVRPFREAIRLAPDARAWANLGYVYYAQGKLADAVRAYEEAARLEPASGTIRRSLGDTRAKARDATGARADWRAAVGLSRTALQVNPRDPRQLKNVAICLAKLGEREEALRVAGQALEVGPKSPDARYGVAVVHALVGDTARALTVLGEAFDLGASPALADQDDDLAAVRALPGFRSAIEKARTAQTKEVKRAP
ncbi:MAG TPA: protein kinase [Vicinamibacteria bacterium]|nr:protein kinase [Vicinamibacteria bacterium]